MWGRLIRPSDSDRDRAHKTPLIPIVKKRSFLCGTFLKMGGTFLQMGGTFRKMGGTFLKTDRQTVLFGTETRDPHYAISRRSAPLTHAHGGACRQSSPVGRALLLLTLSVAHPSHAPYGSRDSRGVCVHGTREVRERVGHVAGLMTRV